MLENKSRALNLNLQELTINAVINQTIAIKNEFAGVAEATANAVINMTTTIDEKFIYIATGTIKTAGKTKYT